MMPDFWSLVVPAFIAGLLTFFAPCTFPLIPGYIGFLSGANGGPAVETEKQPHQKKVLINALLYVLGFSLVFIALGTLFSIVGVVLGPIRLWLTRIGGLLVIFFGLYLLGFSRLPIFAKLAREERFHLKHLTPGNPASSFFFGAAFAFGWTPCIGPILGSVLLLAGTQGTVAQGALLLTVFSLGLAIPFLLVAALLGSATRLMQKIRPALHVIEIIGGSLLVVMGFYLLTDQFVVFTAFFTRLLESSRYYETILNYL